MQQVTVLDGIRFKPTIELSDPKGVFEYLWKEFCLQLEADSVIPSLVFFIKNDFIEVFDLHIFTYNVQGKDIVNELICKRVEQEPDIEGVAISFEAAVRKPLLEESDDVQVQDTVILSLDWKGVGSTFARLAKKVKINNTYKLVDVTNTDLLRERFTTFFQQDQLQVMRERINLQ
jgi:hypothetical protein